MIKQPDQELYDEVYKICQALGYSVFTYLPDDKTPYPFVYLGESQELPQATKNVLVGKVQLSVHVYGLATKRKQVSDMKGAILYEVRKLRQSKNFNWKIANNQTQPQMLSDKTTHTPLWHAVIPLEMQFY